MLDARIVGSKKNMNKRNLIEHLISICEAEDSEEKRILIEDFASNLMKKDRNSVEKKEIYEQ